MFIAEFLYRGRHEAENMPASYHAILGDSVSMLGENKIVYSSPMTPEQLEGVGYSLPTIIADINAQLLKDNDKYKATTESLSADLASAYEAMKELQDKLSAALAREAALEQTVAATFVATAAPQDAGAGQATERA